MKLNENQNENDESIDDADVDSEESNDNDVIYEINTYGADFTVDGLVSRFERGDIYQPDFQRKFIWTLKQASRLIESMLLGLPIPSVFLYKEADTGKHLIIDGLQRLTTLSAFYMGTFPGNNEKFRLAHVRDDFKGCMYSTLDARHRRRFEDTILHATIVQQFSPSDDGKSSVYHIFDRLNTNGTPLTPQEMRTSIYHGRFQKLLQKLNENRSWRKIFGDDDKRAKDQEFILRFLALANNRQEYAKPMKIFLNNFMDTHQSLDDSKCQEFSRQFIETIERIYDAIGKQAFRPNKRISGAVYDAVMVAILENKNLEKDEIKKRHSILINDDIFLEVCRRRTTDDSNVRERIKIAKDIFDAS